MLGIGGAGGEKIVAVADIANGSVGIAILGVGKTVRVFAVERASLPMESRTEDALATLVVQEISTAAEKALATFNALKRGHHVSAAYAVVGPPWTHSYAAHAASKLDHEAVITDAMIGALAQKALAEQKDIDRAHLLEASVTRVLLNGYPTSEPTHMHAHQLDVFALASDCDARIKAAVEETFAKLFPGAPIAWRSSARAILSVVRELGESGTCLVVHVGSESTDLMVVRKGILSERTTTSAGMMTILSGFAKDKPVEETFALLQLLERDQCEDKACEALKESIARAEPDLVRLFGEGMAKLAATRHLPHELILIAPMHLIPWLTRFFSRIDFTQFTATTQPFAVRSLAISDLAAMHESDPHLLDDPGLEIGCALVNIELRT